MTIETLQQPYIIGDESGDFIAYACRDCAEEFAKDNGLEWNSNRNSTEEHESGLYAYDTLWDSGESDTPTACSCGQYLDVQLTKDGKNYVLEHGGFPEWLLNEYGISSESE